MDTMGQQVNWMVNTVSGIVLETLITAMKKSGRTHITLKELEHTLEQRNKRILEINCSL